VSSGKASQADVAVFAGGNEGFSPVDAAALANDTLTPSITPTAANSLGLDIQANDVGYVATVYMGTPPRPFNVVMDTGSADLWVGAEGCISTNGTDCVRSSPAGYHTHLIP
jgi:Eukaryotic aspartyl protease